LGSVATEIGVGFFCGSPLIINYARPVQVIRHPHIRRRDLAPHFQ
jgi:hypothetical protein